MKPKPNSICDQGEIPFQKYSVSHDMLPIRALVWSALRTVSNVNIE